MSDPSEFTAGPVSVDCLHSLGIDGVCRYCNRNILSEAAAATTARLEPQDELKALAIIVSGFEVLPEEARARTFTYLISRFPQQRTTR